MIFKNNEIFPFMNNFFLRIQNECQANDLLPTIFKTIHNNLVTAPSCLMMSFKLSLPLHLD